ncbi:hypothetical protein D3C87_330060 [compost metagenome]
MKKKLVFALIMGVVTTGIISFSLISINIGFVSKFMAIWLKSWLMAYVIVIPAILVIAPKVERFVEYLLKEKAEGNKNKIQ